MRPSLPRGYSLDPKSGLLLPNEARGIGAGAGAGRGGIAGGRTARGKVRGTGSSRPGDTVAQQGGGGPLYTTPGPNKPVGLTTLAFALDPRQADQTVLNAGVSQSAGTNWASPETLPNNGAFFGLTEDSLDHVRFEWKTGQTERCANREITGFGTFTEFYVRIVRRWGGAGANDWEWNGGTVKDFFFQNTVSGQNSCVGQLQSGRWSFFNANPQVIGTNLGSDDVWYDDEMHISALPSNTAVIRAWRDGVLEIDDEITDTDAAAVNLLNLGPFHGGSGAKSADGDFWDYRCMAIWGA